VTGAALIACLAALALAGCDTGGGGKGSAGKSGAEAEAQIVDVPQTVTATAPGTTPMAERIAVLGLLNKRNGISRDLSLKPGQAARVGNVIVRLRACETSAPWEVQKLTGAFVQLDVRNPQGQYVRAFSGWLYKETPSLNVVEHAIYDVWPKSCAMTHPGGIAPAAGAAPSRSSSAPKSAPAEAEPAPAPENTPSEPATADDNIAT